MRSFWKEWGLIVIGQACCVGVGIWLFAAQALREVAPAAPPRTAAQQAQVLLILALTSVVWVTLLQAMTSYLVMAMFRDDQKRRSTRTAHENMRQMQQYVRARDAIIFGLAKLAESRDAGTGRHLERITDYARVLAEAARTDPQYSGVISAEFIRLIQLAAALHDIGKVGIEDSILLKPGPLTTFERERMQQHTLIATSCLDEIVRRVGPSPLLQMAREIALGHHEHWNGGGYPYGLQREQIPLAARIVAIADVYDALISARPYKSALSHDQAVAFVQSAAGTQFDPDLVRIWLGVQHRYAEIASRSADLAVESRFEAFEPGEDRTRGPDRVPPREAAAPSVGIEAG